MPRRLYLTPLAVLALAALVPAAALAHHGWSSYDASKTTQLTGPFRTVAWGNPHGSATMSWQGRTWDVILAPVSRMEARGLTRAMIAPGARVTIVGYPRSDGTPEMRIERVTADGRTVELR